MAYGLFGWNGLGGKKKTWGLLSGIMIWEGLGWGASSLFLIYEIMAIIEQGEWRKTYERRGWRKSSGGVFDKIKVSDASDSS